MCGGGISFLEDHAATFEKPQAARAGSRPGQSPDSNNNAGRAAGINRKVKLGASTRAGRALPKLGPLREPEK